MQKMVMKKNENNHYFVMFFIMVLSGLLSTMNMWVDKLEDVRLSMNDLYMVLLMTGWMFLFMGLYYRNIKVLIVGVILTGTNIACIRSQFLISEEQYKRGMIPHHSMAIHMSKKLLTSEDGAHLGDNFISFLKTLITTQEKEIIYMKI
jgi:hypothetical protein